MIKTKLKDLFIVNNKTHKDKQFDQWMQFYGKTSKMKDVNGRTFWYAKKWKT